MPDMQTHELLPYLAKILDAQTKMADGQEKLTKKVEDIQGKFASIDNRVVAIETWKAADDLAESKFFKMNFDPLVEAVKVIDKQQRETDKERLPAATMLQITAAAEKIGSLIRIQETVDKHADKIGKLEEHKAESSVYKSIITGAAGLVGALIGAFINHKLVTP